MEEIKRMIEEVKRTGEGFSYDHVYYSFTKEKLFSLLEKFHETSFSAGYDFRTDLGKPDELQFWQQFLKMIDN